MNLSCPKPRRVDIEDMKSIFTINNIVTTKVKKTPKKVKRKKTTRQKRKKSIREPYLLPDINSRMGSFILISN